MARWARDDAATERPELVERALGWIGRAEKLAGVSTAQREDLRALRAEVGWFEARQLLERSADALRQARERLRMAAGSPTPHAREADMALRRIDPLVEELHSAIRDVTPPPGSQGAGGAGAPPNGSATSAPSPSPAPPGPSAPR
jgi:hypothetical protein